MKKIILCIAWCFCFLISNAQNTGIGTTTPVARLHVADSNVVFTGPPTIGPTTLYAPPIQGPGSRMMWYPQKAAFRAGIVDGAQWDKDNIGNFSFAVGSNSIATGEGSFAAGSSRASQNFSTAMGSSIASGHNSTALGFSRALGERSTSMGESTSSGYHSTAMGFSSAFGLTSTAIGSSFAEGDYSFAGGTSWAKSYGGIALGLFNDYSDNPNPNVPELGDRIFQIGNGSSANPTNALTILRNANTGIGTTTPVARLHVTDSNVVFTGPYPLGSTTPFPPPFQGAGSRMMWYPQKAAFRAGIVGGTQWDKDSIGRYSFAVGFNSKAKGEGSFAAGISNATENFTTAVGNSTASGTNSTAMGSSIATGSYSTAMGSSIATGAFSTAVGSSTATGIYAFAGGLADATAPHSTAIGYINWAKAYGGVALGISNDISDNPDPNVASSTDRLFQIGNGSGSVRSNALTILRNGNAGIGTTNPIVKLHISGGASSGTPYGGAQLAVEHLDHTYISMISPDAKETGILFGKSSSTISGGILYNNASTLNGLQFRTNGNQTRMSINSTGDVGIGTEAPFSPLTFNNNIGQKISLYGNASNNYGLGVQGALLQIHSDAAGADIAFGYGSSGAFTETMRIKGNGNAIIQGTLTVAGVFYPSDARYKRNLAFIKDALPRILQLNGYNYNWKDEAKDPSLQTGLIAQEIKNIFPELVREDSAGYLSVNYTGLIPYLIESIKELKKENEELKKMKMEWAEMKEKMEKLLSK